MRFEKRYRVIVSLDVLATDPVDAACAARVELDTWIGPAARFQVTPHPFGRTVCVDLSTVPATIHPADATS